MKRLFIAVDIDDPTREAIGRISSNLRERSDARARVSWVRSDRMHLTLHFEAHADERMERHILDALADPLAEAPFSLSFEGLGFFPSRGSPRVLWLGVRDGLAELRRVQQILAGRLRVGRDQPFSPHLTLARFRPSTHAQGALRALEGRDRVRWGQLKEIASIQASAGPCRIDRVTVYESRLSPAAPTYLRLAEAPLTP